MKPIPGVDLGKLVRRTSYGGRSDAEPILAAYLCDLWQARDAIADAWQRAECRAAEIRVRLQAVEAKMDKLRAGDWSELPDWLNPLVES